VSPGSREENRLNVSVTGTGASRVYSDYSKGPRIYDYDVTFSSYSPYLHLEVSPLEKLRFTAGLRYDTLNYDFRNRLDDSVVQGGAAAFYGQARNGDVDFDRLSPKIGATYALNEAVHLYASYNTGFRAPSESQLFRPSVAASPADAAARARLALNLEPITATQIEIGSRIERDRWSLDVAMYELIKRDDLVSQRDTTTNVTTSVNAGKSRHRGIEVGVGTQIMQAWRFDSAFSYTRHEYEEWRTANADFSGNEMEAAPRWLANSRLSWTPTAALDATLEWIHVGSYWLGASNSPGFGKYGGHDLVNLRARWQASPRLALFCRAYNLTDRRYADSAQVSSNTPVYSPGLPRTYFAGVDWQW
jgi:outer membrane receptor protein involved in Fe transport